MYLAAVLYPEIQNKKFHTFVIRTILFMRFYLHIYLLNENKYSKALEELRALEFDIRFTIGKLTILRVNNTFTGVENTTDMNM